MPIAIILMAINVAFIVHAAKTGRFNPWGYVILFLPGVGAVAYVLVELIPEWMGTYKGQQARKRVVSTLNPEREYRQLTDELAIADTIANRSRAGRRVPAAWQVRRGARSLRQHPRPPDGRGACLCLGQGPRGIRLRPAAGGGGDARRLAGALARFSIGRRSFALCPRPGRERPHRRGARGVQGGVELFRRRRGAGALGHAAESRSAATPRPRRSTRNS